MDSSKLKVILADVIKVENEKEEMLLQEFRDRVKDLREEDVTLLRFMRAREYDISKAEDMLRKAIKWRKDNEISSILEWDAPNEITENMPFRMLGHDNVGAPVIWLPLGRWKGRHLVEKGVKADCLKMGNFIIENANSAIKEAGNKPCHVIIGVEQLSLYQISHIETMQTLFAGFQNLEQNYPEVLKRIHIINAPWIFTMAFNFIKPILSAHTIAKIQVFGSNKNQWMPLLLNYMPEETIPKEYREE